MSTKVETGVQLIYHMSRYYKKKPSLKIQGLSFNTQDALHKTHHWRPEQNKTSGTTKLTGIENLKFRKVVPNLANGIYA